MTKIITEKNKISDELLKSIQKEAIEAVLPEDDEMTLGEINNGYEFKRRVITNAKEKLGIDIK